MCDILAQYDPLTDSTEIQQLNLLYEMRYVLDRMYRNILLINSGVNVKTINATNTTLFHIAANEYDDATLWTYLADVNKLTDFKITEPIVLMIPPKPTDTFRFGA